MACTQAVEDTVVAHYGDQLARLGDAEPALTADIARIRDEEQEHCDHAIAAGAQKAPGYNLIYRAISLGCRTAIAISQKL